MFRILTAPLRRFRYRDDGSVSIEAALYLPLLLGVFAAMYTLFDLFRQDTVNTKAAYTISDLISRETTALNDDYINSMYELGKLLVRKDTGMSLRISVVHWDEADDRYYVDWSVERGALLDVLTDGTVETVEDKLPTMPDQERVIVVETWNDVAPIFNIGLATQNIYNLVFTRPRFASQVAYEGKLISDGGAHDDGVGDESI
ncbi:TadE/TadG family type IV pilus assembly protein [Phaeobacter sp. HF9A]|uniref:TadE/TadG family type IV pilus assembly protein n=1 Tax=Phaeobacter sp. HF9A TaxID=2721561 RepID=UPI0014308FBD|nr:pilus assembly protein [Phaeobacter sp. HF9A]NIZ13463.1 pilus assembly protein [Phaeobacter sp. HF9A]